MNRSNKRVVNGSMQFSSAADNGAQSRTGFQEQTLTHENTRAEVKDTSSNSSAIPLMLGWTCVVLSLLSSPNENQLSDSAQALLPSLALAAIAVGSGITLIIRQRISSGYLLVIVGLLTPFISTIARSLFQFEETHPVSQFFQPLTKAFAFSLTVLF